MRKLALCLLLILTLALPASPADYYHLTDYVTNTYGSALSGVFVYIYDPPGQASTTATAYTDLAGSNSVTYPLTTDSNGMWECYIANGTYDINVVHSGHNIDQTWDNYMVPLPTSPSVACVDTLKGCTDDTLHVRASDGARHGVLQVNNLMLENAYGHDGDRAAIRFGPSASGTDNPHARIYLPYYGLLWMTRSGYSARVPNYDWNGGTPIYNGHMMLGIGGTTGKAFNWQFWEDTQITFARAMGDSVAGDTTGLRYNDRSVISFSRKLSAPDGGTPPDAAYATADTQRCDAYQSLDIRNDHFNRLSWMHIPRGAGVDTLHGVLEGPYGTPDYGIKLQTDLPDSNGSEGRRDAVRIRWHMSPSSGEIRYAGSSFLTMYEHDTVNYRFARDYLELRPSKEGNVNKGIRFFGSGGGATKMKIDNSEGAFLLYVTNKRLNIYDSDGSDDATLDCYQADFNYLTSAPLRGALPTVAEMQVLGNGTYVFRHFDTEPAIGGTLFVWDDADTTFHYFVQDGTKAAN